MRNIYNTLGGFSQSDDRFYPTNTALLASLSERLAGMNENSCSVELPESNQEPQEICNVVYSTANVAQVGSSQPETLRFAGRTISSGSDALITITKLSSSVKAKVTVNCEKMVIGSMLLKDLKSSLIST